MSTLRNNCSKNSYITLVLATLTLLTFSSMSVASNCVILLHGLARSSDSMSKIEKHLTSLNYIVVNQDYASTQNDIKSLANEVIPKALEQCQQRDAINFVTHSMGGILVRQYLSQHKIENLKHVVMLGPPNAGSEVVDKMKKIPGFKTINGPAGLQLGTDDESIPKMLGPANFSLGIIAGTRSVNLILSTMLPNPDDGKVSVESTKLVGMKDHISLPVTHPFMMKNKDVIKQISHFLDHGEFEHLTIDEETDNKGNRESLLRP